jgi:transcriptional regulator with XRE-family HTH domain
VKNDAYQKFRDLLVDARKKAAITQAELSGRLKRPQSFVSKYERGERRLDVIEFGDVARALGIDPLRFLRRFYEGES